MEPAIMSVDTVKAKPGQSRPERTSGARCLAIPAHP